MLFSIKSKDELVISDTHQRINNALTENAGKNNFAASLICKSTSSYLKLQKFKKYFAINEYIGGCFPS